jgi:3-hydroxyacyl-CoA dehydrogenase/enoyl-CoA hydratase/3-hydroxybutyryl-CoA epimerase
MSITYEKDKQDIVTLTMDMQGRSTNVINESFLSTFRKILDRLQAETSLNGVIVTSAKKTFLVGGDLDWLLHLHDPAEAFQAVELIKVAFRELEKMGKPVVAAINGSALGGGLELAFACHYRIAIDDERHKIGFPEVNLGLLPGAGGIIRLTRLLGLQEAFPYLMEGKQVNPQAAKNAGLIDELATDQSDLLARAVNWIVANPRAMQPWDKPRYRMPGGNPSHPRVAQMLAIAPAMLKK